MSKALKKSDLIDLLDLVDVKYARSDKKSNLEDLLRLAVAESPSLVLKDQRLKAYAPDNTGSEAESENEIVAAAEEAIGEVVQSAQEVVTETVAETKFEICELTRSLHNGVAELRVAVTNVKTANVFLALVELTNFAYVEFTTTANRKWPSENWTDVAKKAAVNSLPGAGMWLLTLIIPLLVAFVLNFSKQPVIRRKKHEFTIDPEVYGLSRLITAFVLQLVPSFKAHYQLSVVSGFVSAVLALYAALLQTI